jgi:hypothetical protein
VRDRETGKPSSMERYLLDDACVTPIDRSMEAGWAGTSRREATRDGKGTVPLCVCVCVCLRAGVGMERIGWMDVTTRRPGVCALPEFRNGPPT